MQGCIHGPSPALEPGGGKAKKVLLNNQQECVNMIKKRKIKRQFHLDDLTPKQPYGVPPTALPGGGGGKLEEEGKRPRAPRFSPGIRCVCCCKEGKCR